ncbi:alkaline ceramidase [Oenococcus sp. UCMA 14587]|nr:alkaline ceramidase [Oenococcus sp. UCMA 14587]
MKIGTARYCISPSYRKFYLLGYKNPVRNNPAAGIHDDIFCNALLFDNGNHDRVFVLSADLLELEDDMVEEVKSKLNELYGISRDQIILCVTHDHSSIRDFHKHWETGHFNQQYYDFLIETIIKAFEKCLVNLQVATAKYGKEVITGYYSNRNHPGELADNQIIVIKFYNKQNEAFACLLNWATHSTVLGPDNNQLTGDLAGQTCQKLGEQWGYYPLMVVGAAADSSNRNDRQGKDFAELERASSGLAEKVIGIPITKQVEFGSIVFQTLSHSIHPNMKKYHDQLQQTISDIKSGELLLKGSVPATELISKCQEQLKLNNYNLLLQFEVLDIGNLRFYIFPGELGSKFGLTMKSSTNKVAIIAGYANGFHYYFLPEREYGLSFETIGNPVPSGEAEKIVAKLIQSGQLIDK